MKMLVNVILATVCWLGLFEPHLILPLAKLPVLSVLETLTVGDYFLWVISLGGVVLIDRKYDHYLRRNKRQVVSTIEPWHRSRQK